MSIKNVFIGLANEAFCTIKWDTPEKSDYRYVHYYISRLKDDSIEGYQIEMNIAYVHRNKLLQYFVASMLQDQPPSNIIAVFNTYQHQTRTLLEAEGFFTYTEEDHDVFKKGDLIIKTPCSGLVATPFMKECHAEQPKKEKVKKPVRVKEVLYVYLMHNRRNNYYKIGRSNNPEYREKTLQAEDPDIALLNKWIGSSALEKHLHNTFRSLRIRGEWFALKEDDITSIDAVIKSFKI